MVKNPPANIGDTGSIPGLGGSHMPQSNDACAPEPRSLGYWHALEPVLAAAREKPVRQQRPSTAENK